MPAFMRDPETIAPKVSRIRCYYATGPGDLLACGRECFVQNRYLRRVNHHRSPEAETAGLAHCLPERIKIRECCYASDKAERQKPCGARRVQHCEVGPEQQIN